MEKHDDALKYQVITELGLIDKVKKQGLKCLSAKETGKIGGLMAKKKKMLKLDRSEQI